MIEIIDPALIIKFQFSRITQFPSFRKKKKFPPYSAMKIKANKPEPYSILKPDTNSDSPPEKSDGVQLASAIQEITHSREMNGITKRRERNLENFIISSIS